MTLVRAAALSSALALLVGCQHVAEHHGPEGIAYACAGGGTARIIYDGGDPTRAPARLLFDGHEYGVAPAPAMNGLRYVGETGPHPGYRLVWWAEGDAAIVSELAVDPAASVAEREIARCTRIREGEAAAPEPGHGA